MSAIPHHKTWRLMGSATWRPCISAPCLVSISNKPKSRNLRAYCLGRTSRQCHPQALRGHKTGSAELLANSMPPPRRLAGPRTGCTSTAPTGLRMRQHLHCADALKGKNMAVDVVRQKKALSGHLAPRSSTVLSFHRLLLDLGFGFGALLCSCDGCCCLEFFPSSLLSP